MTKQKQPSMSPQGAHFLEYGWCGHPVDTAASVRDKIITAHALPRCLRQMSCLAAHYCAHRHCLWRGAGPHRTAQSEWFCRVQTDRRPPSNFNLTLHVPGSTSESVLRSSLKPCYHVIRITKRRTRDESTPVDFDLFRTMLASPSKWILLVASHMGHANSHSACLTESSMFELCTVIQAAHAQRHTCTIPQLNPQFICLNCRGTKGIAGCCVVCCAFVCVYLAVDIYTWPAEFGRGVFPATSGIHSASQ